MITLINSVLICGSTQPCTLSQSLRFIDFTVLFSKLSQCPSLSFDHFWLCYMFRETQRTTIQHQWVFPSDHATVERPLGVTWQEKPSYTTCHLLIGKTSSILQMINQQSKFRIQNLVLFFLDYKIYHIIKMLICLYTKQQKENQNITKALHSTNVAIRRGCG